MARLSARELVDYAEPLAKPRYLRMVSFASPEKAPGWYASRRVFPYYEAKKKTLPYNGYAELVKSLYG